MKWLKKFLMQLQTNYWKIMVTLKTGKMPVKPKRPKIHKIWNAEIVDGEIVFCEKYIIVNHKGETMEAPIFETKENALNWLDEHHPACNYSPE